MSENYHIGLSREQLRHLLKGEEVGKRPYDISESYNDGQIRYNGNIRIFIRLLSDEDQLKEPDTAFTW